MMDTSPEGAPEARVMSFWDHLEELRWRIIKALIAVVIGAAVSLAFSNPILAFLLAPVKQFGKEIRLINLTPLSMVIVRLYIGLMAGLLVGLPVIVFQLWRFISPGLYRHERRAVPWVLLSSLALFVLGAWIAYSFIPFFFKFLVAYGYQGVENTWNIRDYMSFLLRFMAGFGLVFELPVAVYILSLVGVVTPALLRKSRRWAIVIIFIVAALLTPPDPFSQIAMAIPLLILFEISILVSAAVWKNKIRRRKQEIAESESGETSGGL